MSEDADTASRISSATEDEIGNNQQPFLLFVAMDELSDNLKLLNYEEEFIKTVKIRRLNRHYFALQTNPGEQFFMFVSLASWLIKKCGKYIDTPQEYDDPNSTIAVILDIAHSLDITIDFPTNKLKQGYGRHAIYVLNCLAEKCLRQINFVFNKPVPPYEVGNEEPIVEDDSELLLERIEEEMAAEEITSDDDEDLLLRVEDLNKLDLESQRNGEVLESSTNIDEWQLELERVLPLLKITVRSDARDWRSHLQQIKQYRDVIKDTGKVAKLQMDRLILDVSDTMDKISTREKFLNSSMENTVAKYKLLQTELSKYNERYHELNGGVIERQKKLSTITDELEAVKQEMETRGSSMTDETPVIRIKKSINAIRSEIADMDVQIGVKQHDILQAKLRDKLRMRQDLHSEVYA